MINAIPLKRRVLRILTGRQTYQEVSDKCWTLCPSESAPSPPAIYLDGELDKVSAVQENTSHDYQMEKIRGKRAEHAPTLAYRIRNAHVLDGYVYKGAMKHPLVATKESLFSLGGTDYIPKAAITCTLCGNHFFGHWMRDDLTLTLAAQQFAEAITVARKLYTHEPEYRHLYGIQARSFTRVQCDELIVIDDFGQNQFKRERYELLRSRLKVLEPLHSSYGVMIRRGISGVQRLLTNEAEVEQFLMTRGFTIIDPERMSATEIVRRILGAKIVVGTEGSHMVHGIFPMANHGTILTLQPPYRFNNVFKDYTDSLDMHYAFVVGKPAPDGFTIALEDLARTLDKIETLTG